MPGGTYPMGRSVVSTATDYYANGQSHEVPEHGATAASFALDKYEVTVGRYRAFVAAYDTWHKTNGFPTTGTGAHPIASNTGWNQSWTAASSDLPADSTALIVALKCNASSQTWQDTASTNESYPINCVSWYEAFAFCIWDGGRLPTEAEWEYAAAGGLQNLLYPWGSLAPSNAYANYNGSDYSSSVAVGSKLATGGGGYFGHADFAGSMWEWVFDGYSYYGTIAVPRSCDNCANTLGSNRVLRGGGWSNDADYLRAAYRNYFTPSDRNSGFGFRCARTPQ